MGPEVKTPDTQSCSFKGHPQSRSQHAHTKFLFPDFNFFSKKLYGLLVTEVCLLVCLPKQEADVTCELTKTVSGHTTAHDGGNTGHCHHCKQLWLSCRQNMWDQDHLEPKISFGLESVQIPLSPTCCLFLCAVHHHKLILCSLAEKELNLQVKTDHILHCAPQILLQQTR